MSKNLKGIGASGGISIADAFIIREEKITISKEKPKSADIEIKNINNCIKKAIDDLNVLRDETLKKLGEEKAEIFNAHISILEDPELIKEIIDKINNEQYNAARAVSEISFKYVEMFSAMDDEYFKERAADVKDVTGRLIKYILGIKVIDLSTISKEVIVVADDLTPSQTSQLNPKYVKGFVCNIGGRTSHAAIMARSLEIPAVLGLKNVLSSVKENDIIALDGDSGVVEINPTNKKTWQIKLDEFKKEKAELEKFKKAKTITKDGFDKFVLEGNIGQPSDVEAVIENGGEGVGLFRSEFLYMDNDHFPTEEEQFIAYKKVIDSMKNHIVVIRTLDIGGDKKLSYFEFPHEMNPFLGYRAIRFTLDKKDIFRDQIRALLRASAFGKLGIMFPMIATIDEFKNARNFVKKCQIELDKEKIAYDKNVQIGMMVEIPSTAILAEKFAKYADFFSVGTNDLIQYTFAADRMSEKVSYLYQPLNPSILNLLKLTIDGAHKHNRWVGMCGEMAGEPHAVPLLMGLGLDAFSMSATSIPKARSIMTKWTLKESQDLAIKALNLETVDEVAKLVETESKKK